MPKPPRPFPASLPLLLACCALAACATPAGGRRAASPADALTLRELTIVDEHGTPRVRIGAPLPSPQGLVRKVKAVGIQFMDPSGAEIGGLAMLDAIGVRGLCFDSEEGYEAMCMGLVQGQPTVTFRHDWKERITIDVTDGVARVVLHDAGGTPRLRLEVDREGATRIVGADAAPAGR